MFKVGSLYVLKPQLKPNSYSSKFITTPFLVLKIYGPKYPTWDNKTTCEMFLLKENKKLIYNLSNFDFVEMNL